MLDDRSAPDQRKAFLVPLLLRTYEEQRLVSSTRPLAANLDASTSADPDPESEVEEQCLHEEMESFNVTQVISVFFMLVTFGIVNSLLGFVLLVSLYVSSLWQQVLIGRFVTLALHQQDGDKRRVEQLERACARVALAPLRDVIPYVIFVSSFFLACFLLDMAADTQGPLKACWAPLLLVSIVFIAWLFKNTINAIGIGNVSSSKEEQSRQRPEVETTNFSSPLSPHSFPSQNNAVVAERV